MPISRRRVVGIQCAVTYYTIQCIESDTYQFRTNPCHLPSRLFQAELAADWIADHSVVPEYIASKENHVWEVRPRGDLDGYRVAKTVNLNDRVEAQTKIFVGGGLKLSNAFGLLLKGSRRQNHRPVRAGINKCRFTGQDDLAVNRQCNVDSWSTGKVILYFIEPLVTKFDVDFRHCTLPNCRT